MAVDVKQYMYSKGTDPVMDKELAAARSYGKVKPGQQHIFWKSGLRWYAVPVPEIQRIFRRLEPVIRKLCCGGKSYYIERLVMVLQNGEELVVHIGDDIPKDAEALLAALKAQHPDLQYGKV